MADRLLTPSKITAWLDCAHYLTLQHRVEAGTIPPGTSGFGSLAQLLVDKGTQHEAACLAEYRARGPVIYEVPPKSEGESFASWVERVGNPMESGHDVIYQMPFLHDGVRGVADFLVRVEEPGTGFGRYEPVDAKLARSDAKPGHVLQLCFYADAIEALTGSPPEHLHLWLGSGEVESLVAVEFRPYWRRLRSQLAVLLDGEAGEPDTVPEPCAHCDFCEFQDTCSDEWRANDSLIYVAGVRGDDRLALEAAGLGTMELLAERRGPVEGMRAERLDHLVGQAGLQIRVRSDEERPPPCEVIQPSEDPAWGRGFDLLPEPDEGDVFLDFEGDPFWQADVGLFFLFGLIAQGASGTWDYETFWSHDRVQEASATEHLIEFLVDRRKRFPSMHVYHFNHTERSSLERLTADHGVGEAALAGLIETGLFVDLLPVVRNSVQIGVESYGLKHLERVTGYQRGHEIDKGAGAVVEYEQYMVDGEEDRLDRIASYNEDDVRSTLALRDWLVGLRPDDLTWRTSVFEPGEDFPELDAQVEALHAFGPESAEHLLGDVLGYWLRERRAQKAPKLAKAALETSLLTDDPEVIAGLTFQGMVARTGKSGKRLERDGAQFTFPDQELSSKFDGGGPASVVFGTPDGMTGYPSVFHLDRDRHEVVLTWSTRCEELGVIPTAVVFDDWVSPRPKPEALSDFAAKVLEPGANAEPNEVSMALLRRELPRFEEGTGPDDVVFTDDVKSITRWAVHLDQSYVAIQGPPGTGKTFRGAHIVHALVNAKKRVGITAMSHNAIDNLLAEIVDVFAKKGGAVPLHCVRKGQEPSGGGLAGVTYTAVNAPCARDEFNLVAGTTWLFAGKDMKDAPVDVLIVDEAGQLALADALAASRSVRNLILLGDPLQLPQVSQASHPGGGGLSVLEHVMGEDRTLPPDRGVFLTETWRMHPDICRFISDEIYESRLHSHPSCAIQDTGFGTGLRWLEADHADRSTESEEEAEIVRSAICDLLGTTWTDKNGIAAPITVDDIMVVAPYNDQVTLISETLKADARTCGVRVGTVDKFQGREAPVVFFTMTTSSADDMPRGPEFLFSRNRLNVAVSRARCLAYLVCTERLLNSRARSVDEMRLLSTLCAFVEHTQS
jgi:uncharacterized protein